MKKFKVIIKSWDYHTFEVEADDDEKAQDEAFRLFEDGDVGDIEYGEHELYKWEEKEKTYLFEELSTYAKCNVLNNSKDLDVDGVALGSMGYKEHYDYWNESIYEFTEEGEQT